MRAAKSHEVKIRGLSKSELEALGEALLDFHSLTDLEQWLSGHGKGHHPWGKALLCLNALRAGA